MNKYRKLTARIDGFAKGLNQKRNEREEYEKINQEMARHRHNRKTES